MNDCRPAEDKINKLARASLRLWGANKISVGRNVGVVEAWEV